MLFLTDAAQLLLLLPDRTGELFAWRIEPEITAMVLASAYVAGGYFFTRVLFGAPWARVAAGFPAVIVFVWFAAAATLLHLDRFITGNLAFAAWIALYVVTPVAIPWLYLRERRHAPARPPDPLAAGVRTALLAVGGLIALAGLAMLLAPQAAIDAWPWTLTPLTARIVAAVVALYGSVYLAVALQDSRSGARIPLEAHALGLAVLLLALALGGGDVDWDEPLAPALAVATAALAATSLVLSRKGEGPPRRGGAAALEGDPDERSPGRREKADHGRTRGPG